MSISATSGSADDRAASAPRFPDRPQADVTAFYGDYLAHLGRAAAALDRQALARAAAVLAALFQRGGVLYVCGNGGSAAIANHLTCDMLKGVRTDTALTPRVVSLSCQMELITAIANDLAYAEVFAYQLRSLARAGDAVLAISASGNSDNVVNALEWARANGLATIAMTGFCGGRAGRMADINLHIPSTNYGIVEDAHQCIMHALAQYLRLNGMAPHLIGSRSF